MFLYEHNYVETCDKILFLTVNIITIIFLSLVWILKEIIPSFFSFQKKCTVYSTPNHSSILAWKNPMDRGAWWAAVHGVANSRTRLSNFTLTCWRRKWQPTPVFLPGESQGRVSLVAAIYGVAQSRTRLKWLSSSSKHFLYH